MVTTRTVTLLMLSLGALAVTGALQPVALRLNMESPLWLVALGVVCMTLALFAGRRYLLPHAVTESARKALATTAAVVVISLAAAALVSTLMRLLIGTRLSSATSIGFLWLVALYLAFGRLHQASQKQKLPQYE
jgi:hypothetical protein